MENFLDQTQRRKIFNSIFAVFVLLAVFLGVKTISGIKEYSYIGRGTYAANVITVTGKGEVIAIPDTGQFSFSVVETAKTVAETQTKASAKINLAVDALKILGIEEKDIKTTGYNSYQKYDYLTDQICSEGYCRSGKQILIGYEISQTISVKVRKTADAGAILTKIGMLGISNISGLDFIVDDMDAVKTEAREKAIINAKEKAKVLAKSLGIRLRKIVNFVESDNQPPVYYDMLQSNKAVNRSASAPQVPVGEDTVT